MAGYPAPQADSPVWAPSWPTRIGGLFDRPDDALPDPPDAEDELDDVDDEPAPDDEPDPDDDEPVPTETIAKPNRTQRQTISPKPRRRRDQSVDACAEGAVDDVPPAEPVADATARTDACPPQPIVEPRAGRRADRAETPCEIAADELPQAGP